MRCKKSVLRYVIEEFGNDIHIQKETDDTFRAIVTTATEGLVYWALQYLQDVEILMPKDVRDQIIHAVENNPYGAAGRMD